ncbi:MAG: AAA family ATPase [Deltaproteobacteria bacterium]|nr:AAA family ATPase [Deltaproteobacteria bacterium]
MIISILNTKGGCGKSTIAVNLSSGFAFLGMSTLLVDTDNTGTSMEWSGKRQKPSELLTVISIPNAKALTSAIQSLVTKHDVIVIDGAPQLEDLMTISVAVSDMVIIPVLPSPNDLWKLDPMVDLISRVQATNENITGRPIQVHFVINNFVARTRLSQEVYGALESYGYPVLESKLTTRMDYRDSMAQGTSAIEFTNPRAREEVSLMVGEVMDKLGMEGNREVLRKFVNTPIRLTGGAGGL